LDCVELAVLEELQDVGGSLADRDEVRLGAVALAATAVEQRDLPHENAPSSPCSGSTV
jgi:hypothetical protein